MKKIIGMLGILAASTAFSSAVLAAESVVNPDGSIGGCFWGFCFYIIW